MLMIFEMSTPPLVELGLANPFCVSWCMLCLFGPSGPFNSGKRGLQTVLNAHEPGRPQLLIFSENKVCSLSLSQSSEFLSEHTCMV